MLGKAIFAGKSSNKKATIVDVAVVVTLSYPESAQNWKEKVSFSSIIVTAREIAFSLSIIDLSF